MTSDLPPRGRSAAATPPRGRPAPPALYERSKPGSLSRKLHHLGYRHDRFMWWWWLDMLNFGDWIGPELYYHRTGKAPVFAPVYARPGRHPVLVTVGSLLTFIKVDDVAVVWGSGILEAESDFARPREIRAVRGPITRRRCAAQGYRCPEVYGDPGILIPDVYPDTGAAPEAQAGIVPHFGDLDVARARFGARDDVRIVDVRRPVAEVVADIQACRVIVSSSLHGLITAHAYGRPALHAQFDAPIPGDGIKFHDYHMAAGLEAAPDPVVIAPDIKLEELVRLAERAPRPDLEPLRDPLRQACPF